MNGETFMLMCGGLVLTGGVIWHLQTQTRPAKVGIGLDPSASVARNCGDLRQGVASFLSREPGFREGSTLSFLIMGRDAGSPNPTLAFRVPVPVASDSVYGRDDQSFRRAEAAFYSQIEDACTGAVTGSNSPIYQLLRQGIEHLRGEVGGCGPRSPCYFLLKSDLDEDVEPSLRTLLERAAKKPDIAVPPNLSKSINNDGVRVLLCGGAELRPRRRPNATPETRARIFTALFTHPQLVSARPFCQ
jgi:hypothetical protein